MKIIAHRESLLSTMSSVWEVVPSKSPKPILQNVKVVADTDGTRLIATDLQIGVTRNAVGVEVTRAGSAILSSRVLAILKASPDEEITIESNEELIKVKSKSSFYKLTSEDPDLFPAVPDFDATDYHTVAPADLKAAIARTVFATDPDSARYALGGLLWEFGPETMTVVATDGRRLAEDRLTLGREGNPPDYTNGSKESPAPVVPERASKFIAKMLDADSQPVHIHVEKLNAILIRTDDSVIYSRLVEGRYPRYQDVFPESHHHSLSMPVAPLLGGIRQAAIATSMESRGVNFRFTPEGITLTGIAADVGDATVEVINPDPSCPVDGIAMSIDPEYLLGMLRALPEDATVDIELTDPRQGGSVIKYNGSYKYVVMPLTRDR